MKSDSAEISIVDDDESIRRATKALLRSAGFQVETFASAELFLQSRAARETDCLILDVRMPGMNGLELQRHLKSTQLDVPIIFVTAHDDMAYRATAMDAGAATFFRKPFEADAFVAAVQAALRTTSGFEPSRPENTESSLARVAPC